MDMQPVADREVRSRDEVERSLVLAEAAQAKIRSFGLSPIPRNYEIWYAYETRIFRDLNKAIDDLIAGSGSVGESDLERLHEIHFPAVRAIQQIDKVGVGINAELSSVVELIAGVLGATSTYGKALGEASRDLAATDDSASIKSTVRSLVAATLEMRKDSLQLKSRLDGAIQEISTLQQGLESIRVESRTDPLTELGNR